MNDDTTQANTRQWYIGHWPPLAWVETVTKAAALVIGIFALFAALSGGTLMPPDGLSLAQLIVLSILSLGLLAAIFDRLKEREVVAMVFVVFNNLGHWGMVVALASGQKHNALLIPFCALMLIGDLVKLAFLEVHNFKVRDIPRPVLFGLTSLYAAGYAIVLIMELLR
jgi:hypothetical protein